MKSRTCASDLRKAAPVTAISRKQLFEKLWEYFAPMRKRREEILADKSYIDDVLVRGATRQRSCRRVMTRVRAAVGLC